MKNLAYLFFIVSFIFCGASPLLSQHSVARQWSEVLLDGIRSDFARPTVHSRNLFHVSIAMYDSWAVFDDEAETYLLGKNLNNFPLGYQKIDVQGDIKRAQEEVMSYAVARLLRHRFKNSPGNTKVLSKCDSLLQKLGYDPSFTSTDYENGSLAALGNHLGQGLIDYGLSDGSNEAEDYRNQYYVPTNFPLDPNEPGNRFITDPNRWQPLTFEIFVDQSGNPIPGDVPPFLGPEWGSVLPFALRRDELSEYEKFGTTFNVFHDPGTPPLISSTRTDDEITDYQWGFTLVALWSSHLDPADSVRWDISPASQGNVSFSKLPRSIEDLPDFYKDLEGGDIGEGHSLNPATGQPYEPQMVLRGDYTRVLAEFWADGPDSETPPGHWFTVLNYVNDHALFERKFQGEGAPLDPLEWDVKAYFTLGGAMHDAAVTSWGIKGYYDYIRPVSAIRWMSKQGQASDPDLPNYNKNGIPLHPGFIELVDENDPTILKGTQEEHIGKVKIKAWRGPDYIESPDTSVAGVGWIRAENWWPYQRPTFVTPPFAGYISGHSTFSRAAAEVMTLLTGDPYFPGGMGEFIAPKNEFLVFEDGPSEDLVLQWATYRDASDQTSLSRIWGGIHPPADDIPGRIIGEKIGTEAFAKALSYFTGDQNPALLNPDSYAYPNPVASNNILYVAIDHESSYVQTELIAVDGRQVFYQDLPVPGKNIYVEIDMKGLTSGTYFLRIKAEGLEKTELIQVY